MRPMLFSGQSRELENKAAESMVLHLTLYVQMQLRQATVVISEKLFIIVGRGLQ